MISPSTDGRVQKGNETRRAVTERAVQIASQEGLGALSMGRLATDLGLSKSGVFALFGNKEDLQLATVHAAQATFVERVVEPALAVPAGVARVLRLAESWLDYSRGRVFSGGCFFFGANAEFDAQPGRIRDELAKASRAWARTVAGVLEQARAMGQLRGDADPAQLAFELISFMEAANANSLLLDDEASYARADAAIRRLLRSAASDTGLRSLEPGS